MGLRRLRDRKKKKVGEEKRVGKLEELENWMRKKKKNGGDTNRLIGENQQATFRQGQVAGTSVTYAGGGVSTHTIGYWVPLKPPISGRSGLQVIAIPPTISLLPSFFDLGL